MFKNHNGTNRPNAVFLLIGLNAVSYLVQHKNEDSPLYKKARLVPQAVVQHPISQSPTILSSMFTHANMAHLIFNMIALYQFGRPVEHQFGFWSLLLIFFASGIGSNLMYVLTHTDQEIGLVGASGAISGIMSAYFFE